MKAESIPLFDFLEQPKTMFLVPVYQRNYEWSKEQCEILFNDIMNILKYDKKSHFLGTIVYVNESGPNLTKLFTIIDGQQRITSIKLLLKVLYDITEDDELKQDIEEFLYNRKFTDNNFLKLKSVEKDRFVYSKIMNDEIKEIDNNYFSKLIDNYKLFYELVSSSRYSIEKLFDAISKLIIVGIELDSNQKSENPQIIFESINSTGLSLMSSDLVRNFLLMGINSDSQEKLYHKYWIKIEEILPTNQIPIFLRQYLNMYNGVPINKEKVYEEYKNHFHNSQLDSETALSDLLRYSEYYSWIKNEEIPYEQARKSISLINRLNANTVYPYLMKMLYYVDTQIYSWEDFTKIVSVIESYLYRRAVCDKKTNPMNKFFSKLAINISKTNELLNLMNELTVKKGTLEFPSDNEFVNDFVNSDIYNRKNNIAKSTLMLLEEKSNKEKLDFEKLQVEHIIPQTLTQQWKVDVDKAEQVNERYGNTIGNLTLTGYNSELSNKRFIDKKEFYKDSNISITRFIANNYNKWDEKDILSRANLLSEEIVKIWPYPKVINSEDNLVLSGEYTLSDQINVTGLKPKAITILGEEYRVNSWTQTLILILNLLWQVDSKTMSDIIEKGLLDKVFRNYEDIKSKKTLDNGIVIETNFNAEATLSIIRLIADEYEIFEDVSITL